jgi:hypothetical protein
MRWSLRLCAFALFVCAPAAVLADVHRTPLPEGQVPAHPGAPSGIPCDIRLGYDDGTDDSLDSGPTLGWYSDTGHQYLGVVFTAPPTVADYQVQSASFFADFWVESGLVEFHAFQFDDPSNETQASVNVTGGGTWEVEFVPPICIPAGGEFVVMLCPTLEGGWGVCGEDTSDPDGNSYFTDRECVPAVEFSYDLMIRACVTECGSVSTDLKSWGEIRADYR